MIFTFLGNLGLKPRYADFYDYYKEHASEEAGRFDQTVSTGDLST